MWNVDVIKMRMIEAAEIERRMIVKGMPGGGNAWPAYRFDREDMSGWDDQAHLDHLEQWQGRKVTKSAEISRWEEVFFEWTAIIPVNRRALVWNWARCIASGWSFSEWCTKRGLVRMTAYNRMERVFAILADRFSKEGRLLREADVRAALQGSQTGIETQPTIQTAAPGPNKQKHQPFRTDKHHDNLTTPEAVAAFQQHVSDHNDRMRRRRERSMRGVPVAA